jgi:hypothetical protein
MEYIFYIYKIFIAKKKYIYTYIILMNNSNYYDNEVINKIRLNLNNFLDKDDSNSRKFSNYADHIQTGGESCPCEKVLNAFSKSNLDLALYIVNERNCCNMCIDKDGNTILHHLVNYAFNEDCYSALLTIINAKNSSEYINMQNYKGQTPMILAVTNENEDLALSFKNAGAKTDIRDNEGNYVGTNGDESEVNAKFIKNVVNITLPNKSIDSVCTDDFFGRLNIPKSNYVQQSERPEQSVQSERSEQLNTDSSLNTEQFFDMMVKKNNLIQSMKKEESDIKKNYSNNQINSDNNLSEIGDSDLFFEAIKNKYGDSGNSNVRTQELFSATDEGSNIPMNLTNSDINRLVNEETSEDQGTMQQKTKPVNFNMFQNGNSENDGPDTEFTNSSLVNLSSGTIDSELLKKEIKKLSMLSKFNTMKGGAENKVTKSFRYLNSDSEGTNLSSEAQYLSDFEYGSDLVGGGESNEISRMLNNKKSQLHQEVIDNLIEMLDNGLIKEKSKKIESDEKNAKLVKAYIYKKVSEENPQMTGMDKILLIKGMNNDELVKFISKMPELEKIEKDIQKHIEKKQKDRDNSGNSSDSEQNFSSDNVSSDSSKKSATKKAKPKTKAKTPTKAKAKPKTKTTIKKRK